MTITVRPPEKSASAENAPADAARATSIDPRTRALALTVRQALLMVLTLLPEKFFAVVLAPLTIFLSKFIDVTEPVLLRVFTFAGLADVGALTKSDGEQFAMTVRTMLEGVGQINHDDLLKSSPDIEVSAGSGNPVVRWLIRPPQAQKLIIPQEVQ